MSWSTTACIFGKKAKPAPPPANISLPEKKPAADTAQPQIQPPNVAIESNPPETPRALETTPQLPGPPKPVRPRRTRTRPNTPSPTTATAPPATGAPAPQPQQTQPPASAPLQLAPLLSEADQRAYAQAINDLVSRAERNLTAAETHGPNTQQRELITQARTFVAQAQEIRNRDLAAAKSLAERAEILSREVIGQMK